MLNQLWIPDGPAAKVVAAYCRNFPEHRGKLRIIRAMCRIFWQHGMMVRSDAGKLRIDPLDAIGSFILREGGYERESLARAVELMANGGVFVDVGANIGLFSIAVSANASARCIAVDASAVATARLLENIALNRRQNIQVFNLACSSQPMVRMATVQDGNLGSTRVVEDREVNIAAQWSGCAKLEDIVRACGTTERITLLKADVEGYEQEVFNTLDFSGPFRPKNLIVECDEDGFSSAKGTFHYLCAKGYAPHAVNGKPAESASELIEHNVWFRDNS